MRLPPLAAVWALLASLAAGSAAARPPGPTTLCQVYPDSPTCLAGTADCATCHTQPPGLNAFGADVQAALGSPTSDDADYIARLPAALAAVEALDSDGDGASNLDELLSGTSPADANDVPVDSECTTPLPAGPYQLCAYDPAYAFRRVSLDVCGRSATADELSALGASADPVAEVVRKLEACLRSEFWLGVDGQLWQIAFPKVRPRVPFALVEGAFDPDLNLFVYTQTGDRDARELLTANYAVARNDAASPPEYTASIPQGPQAPDPNTRAGMLTTRWFNGSNTMGQSIPRVTAAQAYRAYLGFDIAKQEGLFDPVDAQGRALPLIDYDDKGITEPLCATCHRTLDSLAYLFSRYAGAGESIVFRTARPRPPPPGFFAANRMEYMIGFDGDEKLLDVPQTGALFGESGLTLVEWAQRAANSEAFAQNLVRDYWIRLVGRAPAAEDLAAFESLWRRFMTDFNYRTELMLRALVQTEAYGVP